MKIVITLIVILFSLQDMLIGQEEATEQIKEETTTKIDREPLDKKIIDMLNLSGGQANFDVAIDQMVDIQKSQFSSEETEEFWQEFKTELKGESYEYLYELLIPIYKKHLTEEEIDAAIAYYETPLGKSTIAKNPMIMQESMQVGAAWGQQVGELIVKKMAERKE